VKIVFYIAAAVMIAVALGALLLPLVRQGRQSGRSRSVFALALAIAFVLPLTAAGLYLLVGTPVALNGVAAEADQTLTVQQAIDELRNHLAKQPGDRQGWMLLAQTSMMQRDPLAARDAYDHVLKLDANNAEAMVGWAEADSMLSNDHKIEGRALDLLKRAVLLQPDSQRGLWLLGISDFQQGQYHDAAATWRLLQPQLEPGSQVAQAVAQQIAAADARAGGAPADASGNTPAAAAQGAALQVNISLAPALKTKLAAGDTLFVYARAAGNPSEPAPPMPLAVAKLDASQLPASVTLTDAMAMTPTMKLSSVPRVFVGARITHSGQPIAQPGDLEGNAGIVAVDSKTPITINIDKVH
jgi:cytochrome c-type biogenesis protein CcmH